MLWLLSSSVASSMTSLCTEPNSQHSYNLMNYRVEWFGLIVESGSSTDASSNQSCNPPVGTSSTCSACCLELLSLGWGRARIIEGRFPTYQEEVVIEVWIDMSSRLDLSDEVASHLMQEHSSWSPDWGTIRRDREASEWWDPLSVSKVEVEVQAHWFCLPTGTSTALVSMVWEGLMNRQVLESAGWPASLVVDWCGGGQFQC